MSDPFHDIRPAAQPAFEVQNLSTPAAGQATRFVARRYSRLQGLRNVLAGVFFLGMAVVMNLSAEDSAFGVAAFTALMLALLTLFLGGDFLVKRWYKENFGEVKSPPGDKYRDWKSFAPVFAAFLAAAVIAALTPLAFPFAFAVFAIGALLVAVKDRRRYGGWNAYSVVYPVALLSAALIVWRAGTAAEDINIVIFACAGVGMIIGGLLDHLQLVRTLGRPVDEPEVADGV